MAYAIGVAQPVSVSVNTFASSEYSNHQIEAVIRELFQLTPSGIIKMLELRQPIYSQTAAYGHFGRQEPGFTWERLDKVEAIQAYFKD